MNERQEYDPVAEFTRPWAERRGIETIDRNGSLTLVRVPLDQLSDVLAVHALETRRNVLGAEIEISGYFELAFQIVGQNWSIIVPAPAIEPHRIAAVPVPIAAELSKLLKSPVIELGLGDTSGVIGYELFDDGEVVEYFAGAEDETIDWADANNLPTQRYILSPEPDEDPEAKQAAYFWSRRRHITAKEIGNIWDFADQFMRESDAYDPGIDSRDLPGTSAYSLKRGGRYRVQKPEFILVYGTGQKVSSVPNLVRVDYFRFGN